jgi:SAM-dependent methyltransferase/transcriptional regulator with XRE-family HTH domain
MVDMAMESHLLLDRLGACVDRVGGKRALAQLSGISEAQLYRYLNGETVVPSDRLVAIADAAKVDSSWLLIGEGTMEKPAADPRPRLDAGLLQDVVREFESLLLEYEVRYTPDQRAKAIALIYATILLDGVKSVDRRDILHCLDFLGLEQRSDMFTILNEALDLFAYGIAGAANPTEWQDWLNRFDNLMALGSRSVMNAYTGELYFARMNGPLPERHVKRLLDLVVETRQLLALASHKPLHWLDVGCGNGRDMAFLHKHAQPIEVRGVDIATRAVSLCQHLIEAGKLPAASVTLGDCRNLPVGDASMHMIYAKMSLTELPYMPGSGIGLEAFMRDAERVLMPRGLLCILAITGEGRSYLPFRQKLSHSDIETLAARHGLRIVRCQETSFGKSPSGEVFDLWLDCVLQKA